jgi:hypothetical protein
MTRTSCSVMMLVAAIMTAGCARDLPSNAQESSASGERQHVSGQPVSSLGTANVLIFGGEIAKINMLRARLVEFGHTVTVRPGSDLPITLVELAQFETVWHVDRAVPLSSAQQALLAEYLSFGGALHLTGEGPGSSLMNASLTAFVRSVVANGSGITIGFPIAVPGQFNSNYHAIYENALGNVANSPNTVRTLEMPGAGGITGVPLFSPNTLVIGGSTLDKVVGAIWDSSDLVSGAGKLSIIMDSDWLNRLPNTNDNLELLQNLQEHMIGDPDISQPQAVAVLPPGQNLDCNDGNNNAREVVPVQLDGSGSIDPDNAPQPLSYTWYENGEQIGSGPTPTVNLTVGTHEIWLAVSDGEEEGTAMITVEITCTIACTPGNDLFNYCHPGCPCDHGEGDCDTDADCRPGLVCLQDPGAAFGYEDGEVDVCSNVCPTLGIGAWNYCSPQCPCDIGEGDCDTDADCLPGTRCLRQTGPAFGYQRGIDVCEPDDGQFCQP